MPSAQKLDTHHKALTVNLDTSTFGSFAEIGAGQEVARWFLLVGAASGTVAKTISAYDKEVSDDLYGSGSRYVSKQRLEAMLDNEWNQLLGKQSTFDWNGLEFLEKAFSGNDKPEHNTSFHYYIVRDKNAHAWTEIWQDEVGWTRVDPTSVVNLLRFERGHGKDE